MVLDRLSPPGAEAKNAASIPIKQNINVGVRIRRLNTSKILLQPKIVALCGPHTSGYAAVFGLLTST